MTKSTNACRRCADDANRATGRRRAIRLPRPESRPAQRKRPQKGDAVPRGVGVCRRWRQLFGVPKPLRALQGNHALSLCFSTIPPFARNYRWAVIAIPEKSNLRFHRLIAATHSQNSKSTGGAQTGARRIIYGTTELLNGPQFLSQLNKLSHKSEQEVD